jgi:hypothetical protein
MRPVEVPGELRQGVGHQRRATRGSCLRTSEWQGDCGRLLLRAFLPRRAPCAPQRSASRRGAALGWSVQPGGMVQHLPGIHGRATERRGPVRQRCSRHADCFAFRLVHPPYAPPPIRRRSLPTWMVGGAGVALACLGLGALAGEWLEPEAGIIPSPAMRQAESESSNALLDDGRAQPADAEEPAQERLAPLIPWAELDDAPQPQRSPADAPAPSNARPVDRATSDEGELAEQRGQLSRDELQGVAGADSPDAGAAPTPGIGADASSSPLEPSQPAPPAVAAPQVEPGEGAAQAAPPGESCGLVSCQAGYSCCNPSCGVCVAEGDGCDPTPCESRIQTPVSFPCGRSTCSVGEVCCNPSCGTCVAPGESCDPSPCDNPIQYPISPTCGRVTCSVGEVCCNPSCGTCVAPGESCSQEWCD